MLIWSQKDILYHLEMSLKKALLHIYEARLMFNIVSVCITKCVNVWFRVTPSTLLRKVNIHRLSLVQKRKRCLKMNECSSGFLQDDLGQERRTWRGNWDEKFRWWWMCFEGMRCRLRHVSEIQCNIYKDLRVCSAEAVIQKCDFRVFISILLLGLNKTDERNSNL